MDEMKPDGPIETALVKNIAIEQMKMQRATRMEANHIDQSVSYAERPPLYDGSIQPQLGTDREITETLIRVQNYGSNSLNKFLKMLHELERLQRRRLGEAVPAPTALDINLHIDANNEDKAELDAPILEKYFRPSSQHCRT
jgi:hypothetical protein